MTQGVVTAVYAKGGYDGVVIQDAASSGNPRRQGLACRGFPVYGATLQKVLPALILFR